MQISQENTFVGIFLNDVAGPQNYNFIKKGLQNRFFSCEFCELFKKVYFVYRIYERLVLKHQRLFKNTFFTEHLQWLFLTVSGFQPEALLKKELQQRRFYLNFSKFLRTFFYRTPPDDCFLCLTIILRSFSDHLFYRAPLQDCLFHVQVAEFQLPDTIKNISKGLFKHFIQTRDVAIPRR